MVTTSPNLCGLCVNICEDYITLSEESGFDNEVYEITTKYFHPTSFWNMGKQNTRRTVMCLECWHHIWDFHNFQESVFQSQKKLVENNKTLDIVLTTELEFLENEDEDVIEMQCSNESEVIQIGDDDEYNSCVDTNEAVPNKTMNEESFVNLSTKTNSLHSNNNNYQDFTYISSDDESEQIAQDCETSLTMFFVTNGSQDNTETYDSLLTELKTSTTNERKPKNINAKTKTIASKKVTVSNNAALSKNTVSATKPALSTESAFNSTVPSSSTTNLGVSDPPLATNFTDLNTQACKRAKQLPKVSTKRTTTKDLDELVSKWMPHVKCDLCSESSTKLSELYTHFRLKHPTEKCYIPCCEKKFYNNLRIEEHISLHINPNAFRCPICKLCFKSSYTLCSHIYYKHPDDRTQASLK